MSDDKSLQFKCMNWGYYLRPYMLEDIQHHIKLELESQISSHRIYSGLIHFMDYVSEKQKIDQQLKTLIDQKVFEPFIFQILAELAQQNMKNYDTVWYYQILGCLSLPLHLQTNNYSFESLQKLYKNADPDLINSRQVLESNLPLHLSSLTDIIIAYLQFQLELDQIVKLKYFSQLKKTLNLFIRDEENEFYCMLSFEVLFGVSLLSYSDSQSQSLLKESLKAQHLYIHKKKLELECLHSRLQEDHELFQVFRCQLYEFFMLRQLIWMDKTSQQRFLTSDINIVTMKIFRTIIENCQQIIKREEKMQLYIFLCVIILKISKNDEVQQREYKLLKILTLLNEIQINWSIDDPVLVVEFKLRQIQMELKLRKYTMQMKHTLLELETFIGAAKFHKINYLHRFYYYYFFSKVQKYNSLYYDQQDQNSNFDNISLIADSPGKNIFNIGSLLQTTQKSLVFTEKMEKSFNIRDDVQQSQISLSFKLQQKIFLRRAMEIYELYRDEFFEQKTFKFQQMYQKCLQHTKSEDSNRSNNFISINSLSQSHLYQDSKIVKLFMDVCQTQKKPNEVSEKDLVKKKILRKDELISTYLGEINFDHRWQKCIIKEYSFEYCDLNNYQKQLVGLFNVQGLCPIVAQVTNNQNILIVVMPIQDISLNTFLMGGVISLISQLRLILSIAKTLMIVHEKGVFHGNLKCSNIFIHNNEIILSDFSIKPTEKIDWQKRDIGSLGQVAEVIFAKFGLKISNETKEQRKLIQRMIQETISLKTLVSEIETMFT